MPAAGASLEVAAGAAGASVAGASVAGAAGAAAGAAWDCSAPAPMFEKSEVLVSWALFCIQPMNRQIAKNSRIRNQVERVRKFPEPTEPNTVCDVYVFDTARGELMIPALKRVVRKVDVDAGVMTLDRAALNEVAVWEDEPAERDE